MQLNDKAQQCQLLREQIDNLVSTQLYPVEDVTILSQQLNTLLNEPIQQGDDVEQYAAFLQLNLDWIQVLMTKLSADKDAMAASMLQVQKGKRARQSYGQHN